MFTARHRFQVSGSVSTTVPKGWMPAQFTRKSRPPKFVTALLTVCWTCSGRLTSHNSASRAWPCASACCWSSRLAFPSMPQARTLAPLAASRRATARPIPVVPVTIAILLRNSVMGGLLTSVVSSPPEIGSTQGSWTELRSYVLEGFDDTAQFRESLQAADVRISRVGFSVDLVAEHVPVIGTHGNFVILAVGAPAPRFLRQQRANQAQHIGTAMKMVSFIERAIGFAHDLAEMHKMDARRELSNHSQQIVISPGAV